MSCGGRTRAVHSLTPKSKILQLVGQSPTKIARSYILSKGWVDRPRYQACLWVV